MKRIISIVVGVVLIMIICCSCDTSGAGQDRTRTVENANKLQTNQPTPTDIEYSLERYNLIRRAYWVNGQREKANTLPCEVDKPLGYVILFSGPTIVGKFVVDGKVSSLNSYLTPDSEFYEGSDHASDGRNRWLADVDGSYGENDSGIFFFTPDGKYVEWNGEYLFSDIPFEIAEPVVNIGE